MLARLKHHIPALGSIAIRGFGVIASFGVTFLIGNRWGPEANGVYALVTQTAIFLSVIAVGGLDYSIVRFLSGIVARGNRVGFASLARIVGLTLTLASTVIIFLGLAWLVVGNLPFASKLPASTMPFLLVLLAARALTRNLGAVLRAQKHYALGQALDGLIMPAIVVMPLAAGLIPDMDAALGMTAAAAVFAAALGLAGCFPPRRKGSDQKLVEQIPIRPILTTAIPIWGVVISQNIADWYGLATVAAQLGTHEAGLYRVAIQFGSAFSIISIGLTGVYSARIGAAQATENWEWVSRLSRSATRLSTVLVVPPAILLFILAPFILSLIGSEFTEAVTMMRVAIVGQMIYVAMGSPGLVLAMTGHERVNFAIALTSTLSLLVVAPIAAAHAGALGVMVWISVIMVARNIAAHLLLIRLTGINGLTGKYAAPAR